jgi:hypothetical protein
MLEILKALFIPLYKTKSFCYKCQSNYQILRIRLNVFSYLIVENLVKNKKKFHF